jgi:putative oxidoreductase
MSAIARPTPTAPARTLTATVAATFDAVLGTDAASAPLVARLSLGLLLFPHGAQHALGWFGGYGFGGTLQWMTDTLGFPAPAAALAIVVELIAPLALVLGLGGRLAAAGIVGLMLGALSTHVSNGFFMNWFGALPAGSEGFEYHLVVIALAAVVLIDGSGAWSLDRRLARAARGARGARAARRAT